MNTIITGAMTHDHATAAGITCRGGNFERKLCRALAAKGITGQLDLHDATTGAPRLSFKDLVKAGEWSWTERDKGGLQLERFQAFPTTLAWAA